MRLLPLAAVFALIFAFAVPGTMLGSHAGPLTASCTNPEVGYTVNFPNNWYYNAHVSSEAADDISACRFFSPEEFTLTPGSEPTGVAVGFGFENQSYDTFGGDAVTVGGRSAYVLESESTSPGFEGMYYTYYIDLGDGTTLTATTTDRWVGDYEENKDILDAMMESLVFGTQPTPTPEATPTPEITPTPEPTMLPDAAMPAPSTATGAGLAAAALMVLLGVSGLTLLAGRRR